MGERTSLNGGKTRPLSAFAIGVLEGIARTPQTAISINPGVVDRLKREDLVELVMLPSPYKSHAGGDCWHLRITAKGMAALDNRRR
jgi:hypothetical protein